MIKALFFDIDGTLVSFHTHRIPDSTVSALRQAKAEGVKVFISTGRPVPFINNLGQIADLIDGYVTANGAYCFVGDDVVCRYTIHHDDVLAILHQCEQWHSSVIVVGTKTIADVGDHATVHRLFGEKLGLLDFHFDSLDHVLQQDILQVTPFITEEQEATLAPLLTNCQGARWHPDFVDITNGKANKAQGMRAVANHVGIAIDETMAFGDGGNDIPIIQEAAIGIAMGNARDEVKQHADYVTTSVDDDGVANALRHFHVIRN